MLLRGFLIAGLLFAAFGSIRQGGSSVFSQPIPTCRPAQLTLSSVSEGAAGGSVREVFRWRNRSTAACVLQGYPRVQLLDAHHRALPTVVLHVAGYLTPLTPVRIVRLNRDGAAFFSLEWGDNPPVGSHCVVSRYVLLIPPGTSSPQPSGGWAERWPICGLYLNASPVASKAFYY